MNENEKRHMGLFGIIWRFLLLLAVVLAVAGGALYKLGEQERGRVSIEEIHRQGGAPVQVARPERRAFTSYLFVDGSVFARNRSMLRAKIDEVVQAVHVRVGEPVEKGQLVVEFRKEDLAAAVEAAEAAYQEATNNYERYRNLAEQQVIAPDRLEQARTNMENAAAALRSARSRLEFAEVRAPMTGVVEGRFVEPGEFKGVGKELLSIIDLNELEVRALVPEGRVPDIGIGDTAEFRLEAGPAWREGRVTRISPSTEDPNRFFDVYLLAENSGQNGRWLMRPGMFAETRFVMETFTNAVALPDAAVVYNGSDRVAYLVKQQRRERPVETGAESADGGPAGGNGPGLLVQLVRGARRALGPLNRLLGGRSEQAPEPGQQQEMIEVEVSVAEKLVVTIGERQQGYVQILEPELASDSRVIINPRDAVKDGALVRVVEDEVGG